MLVADVFVIFDTVQYNPRHEENRAKLKAPEGPRWLTVPMQRSGREQLICDTRVNDDLPWRASAAGVIQSLYARAPRFREHAAEVLAILEAPHTTLTALDRASWEPALRMLGVECRFVLASELPVSGRGPGLLLDICAQLGADVYLSGAFGREYLDASEFEDAGVTVCYHEYRYPEYAQRHGAFEPYMSYLDMLFNVGLDRELVLSGGQIPALLIERAAGG
jgi:hypothetical protein